MVTDEPDIDGWWVATAGKLGGVRLPKEALIDLTLRLRNGTFRSYRRRADGNQPPRPASDAGHHHDARAASRTRGARDHRCHRQLTAHLPRFLGDVSAGRVQGADGNPPLPREVPARAHRVAVKADATYGSDQAGLVCAYVFTAGGQGRAIASTDAAALLTTTRERAEFLWLHFSLANTAAERWLRQHTSLPESFFTPQNGSSTRLEVIEDALTGVLNDVEFFPSEASTAATMTLHVSPR